MISPMHKVERIGMGIPKMKNAMIAAGLRVPTFAPDVFFRAIFYRSPEFAMKEEIGGRSAKGLGETQQGLVEGLAENQKKILKLVAQNRHITKKTMAKEIGISTTAIDKNLTTLKQKNMLLRVGPDKGGHWEIVR